VDRRRFLLATAASIASVALPRLARAQTPWRVGLQAGHWRSIELPDELGSLRGNGGTSGGAVAEWQLNLAVARRAAERLEAAGVEVDVLPATIPPGYQADAFVALHADGDATGRYSGFKLARAIRSAIPDQDDRLLAAIEATYAEATGLPIDPHVTRNMTGYYAFSGRRFTHAIAPTTPAVILEMGFMTNAGDLALLLGDPEALAAGVSGGVYRFLADGAASAGG
jgi:N-acetylmuramoyl-L-alanine amidase